MCLADLLAISTLILSSVALYIAMMLLQVAGLAQTFLGLLQTWFFTSVVSLVIV